MALRVGVVGGGQLARMMIAPAVELGVELRVLAEEDGMSAALAATAVGDYRDAETVLAFARDVDVITFDHEHVPQDVLARARRRRHRRATRARRAALRAGQARHARAARRARDAAARLGRRVATPRELQDFLDAHGGRAVVKTPRGGYDGKGVRVVSAATEADDWFATLAEDARGGALLVEELVDFRASSRSRSPAAPPARSRAYPVVETVQRGGVCAEVIAPAPHAAERLRDVAARDRRRASPRASDVTGMLAVELFETTDERLLVNELAMRPHNSGHWTQDGAVTSQFEQHLRAVLDLPLGDPRRTRTWSVMVNILGGPAEGSLDDALRRGAWRAHPRAKIHTYGKAPRPGRKVGHVNVVGRRPRRRRLPGARCGIPLPRLSSTAGCATVGYRASASARAVAGFFQARALAWSGDPAAAFLRRAPGRRRHGLRLRLARHERRVAGRSPTSASPHEVEVVSAHRTPDKLIRYGREARGARPPGDHRRRRRRGAPARHARLGHRSAGHRRPGPARDARRTRLAAVSIVQMPAGIPVATVSIGGAKNAGLLAVRILGASDDDLAARVEAYARRPRGAGRGEEPAAQGVAVSIASPPRAQRRRPPPGSSSRSARCAIPDTGSRAVMTRRGWWLVS